MTKGSDFCGSRRPLAIESIEFRLRSFGFKGWVRGGAGKRASEECLDIVCSVNATDGDQWLFQVQNRCLVSVIVCTMYAVSLKVVRSRNTAVRGSGRK